MVAFPHIIPDNCSDIAGELFADLLIEDNDDANKTYSIFC